MTTKVKIVAVFPICTVFITALGTVAGFAARADDLGTAVYSGVNRLRQTCGVIGDDPRLTVAAQRHADDMLMNGIGAATSVRTALHPRRVSRMRATPGPATRVRSFTGAPDPMRLRAQRSTCGWKVLHIERSS